MYTLTTCSTVSYHDPYLKIVQFAEIPLDWALEVHPTTPVKFNLSKKRLQHTVNSNAQELTVVPFSVSKQSAFPSWTA